MHTKLFNVTNYNSNNEATRTLGINNKIKSIQPINSGAAILFQMSTN